MLPGAGLFLNALRTLEGDRPISVGFGAVLYGQIPFGSLVTFAQRYGIYDINEFDGFAQILRALDAAELTRLNTRKET